MQSCSRWRYRSDYFCPGRARTVQQPGLEVARTGITRCCDRNTSGTRTGPVRRHTIERPHDDAAHFLWMSRTTYILSCKTQTLCYSSS